MLTIQSRRLDFIDGLLAISILSVIAFHASLPGFAGGYLGVDIFMVISGYLIIGHLVRQKKFSFTQFYAGRALRILPPVIVVVLATLTVAQLIGLAPFET